MRAMATDKTSTLRFRLDVEALRALAADANELGIPPGTLARRIIEARYLSPKKVGNPQRAAGIIHTLGEEVVALP